MFNQKRIYFFILINILFLFSVQAQRRATTDKGEAVILHDDGRWEFEKKYAPATAIKEYTKPVSAKTFLKGSKETYGIWYDQKKWIKQDSLPSKEASFSLVHTEGEGFALIIVERVELSRDKLKEIALKNAQEVAPDVKITKEEIRKVNGSELLLMELRGTIQGVTFVYYSYYYTGKIGAIQFITYTSENLFPEYQKDFEDLLNGFVIIN